MKYYQNPKKHTRSMAVYMLLAVCLVTGFATGAMAAGVLRVVKKTQTDTVVIRARIATVFLWIPPEKQT